jgi:hypothetical protein
MAPLLDAARADNHPVVRSHAVWAIGQISRRFNLLAGQETLRAMLGSEEDPMVREELLAALSN